MKRLLHKDIIIVGLIILIAAIIRLIAVFNFGTYTYDDMFSVHFASMDLDKMFSFLKNDIHPPFYYFLLHFWIRIFGQNEIITRLLSIIFSLGSIPLLYSLTKKILNKWIAIVSCLMLAISYFQIFTAVEVRMYSLLIFLGLLSLNLFWLIFIEQKKLWALYVVINILMLLTNLGGAFGLLTQWLWFLILFWKKQIPKDTLKKFIYSQVIILTCWGVWLIFFFLPQLSQRLSHDWFYKAEINRNPAVGMYDYFFLLLKNYWLRLISGVIIFSAPFMILLWPEQKLKEKMPGEINPNWFLFAWLLPAILIASVTSLNLARIYSIAYLSLYIITAYFFYLIFIYHKKFFWISISVWLIIIMASLSNISLSFTRWDVVNKWLIDNEKPKDLILISCFVHELEFQYYYLGQNDYQGLYLFDNKESLEKMVVEKNCFSAIDAKNIHQMKNLTNQTNKILLINEFQPPDNYFNGLIHQWFIDNNWQNTSTYQPNSILGPRIVIYQKKE